ncbi:MAG: thiolase family protein [Candidatus Competibacteraceae bacterium]|nr:MAG: thiolase family protein [Candidatus Competibacteraceae bacterium]
MAFKEVVIVGAARTAIGKFMGALKDVPARELAMTAARGAIERSGISADMIDEICMGQLYTGMQGSLPARQVSMRIGLPHRSSAVSVNQNCTSGMRALEIACHNIMLGQTDIGLAVGVESMTNAPYLLPKARMGYRMGQGNIEDSMIHDGLFDELVPGHMGMTAENVAAKYGITRQECDELAVISHNRAVASIEAGVFKREIVPVELKSKKGSTFFEVDENPIRDATVASIGKLPTVFRKDGVVTAANASSINDGASAVVVMSLDKARELGLKPLAKLVGICNAGIDAMVMGLGPAVAIPKCLKQAGLSFNDIEYWEVNEAFAAQWLGVGRMLKEEHNVSLSPENCNFNGSGIALGHPVGSTGLRIVVSLCYELERQGKTLGGASLCVGTGPAMASLWSRDI